MSKSPSVGLLYSSKNVNSACLYAITQLGLLFARSDFIAPIDQHEPTTAASAYRLNQEGKSPKNYALFHAKDQSGSDSKEQCEHCVAFVINIAKGYRKPQKRLRADTFYRLAFEPNNCTSEVNNLKRSFDRRKFTKENYAL